MRHTHVKINKDIYLNIHIVAKPAKCQVRFARVSTYFYVLSFNMIWRGIPTFLLLTRLYKFTLLFVNP